jgi:hypothetical protein
LSIAVFIDVSRGIDDFETALDRLIDVGQLRYLSASLAHDAREISLIDAGSYISADRDLYMSWLKEDSVKMAERIFDLYKYVAEKDS